MLDVSGTAIPISNTKLYQGGFGFVVLQAYVPITQNRSTLTTPLCTTYQMTVDNAGIRKQFNMDKHNLLYIGEATLENGDYMLFECPLPKSYTDTIGELEIMIDYCEILDDEIVARITTNTFNTTVSAGAISTGVTIDPTGGELARLNDLTIKVEVLEDSVDALLQQPDVSEANQVGVVDVEINELGRFKFINLKGQTGQQGTQGNQGEEGKPQSLDKIGSAVIGVETIIDLSDNQIGIYGDIDNPLVIDQTTTIELQNADVPTGYQKAIVLYIKRTADVAVVWNDITGNRWAYGEIPILPVGQVQKVLIDFSNTKKIGTAGDYFDV